MINDAEIEEKAHLEETKVQLRTAVARIDTTLSNHATKIKEQKTYLWEQRADMDHAEKVSSRQSAEQRILSAEAVLASKKRIIKLLHSPYFGRFDFIRDEQRESLSIYVGIHSFFDEDRKENLIYDWRAPIAAMFYDFETGRACYIAPSGEIAGNITLKRQFRIRDGHMQFMLESGLNILDDVLQEELSRTSDDRMKNIVATIQRDQNAIIRNEDARELIIQGVAGSGKTSIALHRIAFLLYRYKDTLTSKDILIISPNRVFADYISNVLPELGEENIAETQMEVLANELLEGKYRFETFFEQASRLLENNDEQLQLRIQEKASLDFLKKLDQYAAHIEKTAFSPEEVMVSDHRITAVFIEESFKKHRAMPAAARLRMVAEDIEYNIGIYHHYDLTAKERADLKAVLKKMYRRSTLRATYKDFFSWLGKPALFKPTRGILEHSDVFPLIYLKILLDGLGERRHDVKHLLIDEMQDYTAVQYAVIARLFPCKKTILGDANQSLNPFGSSTAEQINRVFRQADCVKLCKSYRSTWEITRFAQGISPNPDLVAIERHGDEPQLLSCKNSKEESARILQLVGEFFDSGRHNLGVICKTQKQADRLHQLLHSADSRVRLLAPQSVAFGQGAVVCAVHLAKGLEFDQVIICDASERNYSTEMERNLLYVACTRAMHQLTLTFAGKASPFITRERQ